MSLSNDMTRLTTDIGRLAEDIQQAAKVREIAIGDLRGAVRDTMAASATMRGEMLRDYRAETHKFLDALVKDVAAHRHATASQVTRMASVRRKSAKLIRTGLRRQVGGIAKQTRALRTAAEAMVRSMASANHKMAERQRAALVAGHRKLRSEMAHFLGGLHQDRMKARNVWAARSAAGA